MKKYSYPHFHYKENNCDHCEEPVTNGNGYYVGIDRLCHECYLKTLQTEKP